MSDRGSHSSILYPSTPYRIAAYAMPVSQTLPQSHSTIRYLSREIPGASPPSSSTSPATVLTW
eukprot:1563928-Rhodomonas_salina.1